MKELCEGLGQSVGQSFEHDGAVVVVVGLGEPPAEILASEPGRHREHPDVVPDRTDLVILL